MLKIRASAVRRMTLETAHTWRKLYRNSKTYRTPFTSKVWYDPIYHPDPRWAMADPETKQPIFRRLGAKLNQSQLQNISGLDAKTLFPDAADQYEVQMMQTLSNIYPWVWREFLGLVTRSGQNPTAAELDGWYADLYCALVFMQAVRTQGNVWQGDDQTLTVLTSGHAQDPWEALDMGFLIFQPNGLPSKDSFIYPLDRVAKQYMILISISERHWQLGALRQGSQFTSIVSNPLPLEIIPLIQQHVHNHMDHPLLKPILSHLDSMSAFQVFEFKTTGGLSNSHAVNRYEEWSVVLDSTFLTAEEAKERVIRGNLQKSDLAIRLASLSTPLEKSALIQQFCFDDSAANVLYGYRRMFLGRPDVPRLTMITNPNDQGGGVIEV